MKLYVAISIISSFLFAGCLILWFISGAFVKKNKPQLSKKLDYTGGFMFAFSILGGLAALLVWAVNYG